MFPSPDKIIGNREELLTAYINQINKLETGSFPPKSDNIFRFCSYNVKYFKFQQYGSNEIKLFIDAINPDACSLIEYDIAHDRAFKHITSAHDSVLFEQLPGYGIFTMYNTLNADTITTQPLVEKIHGSKYSLYILNKMRILSHDRYGDMSELRGFTHMVITCNLININILSVHLDVYDETGNIRLQEIKEVYEYIIQHSLRNVLILGDFNEWDLKKTDATYHDSLIDFRERTGLDHFSTKAHDFLKDRHFLNVFHMKGKNPKFSCWSGKLVDFCYLFKDTWDNLLEIVDIHMPFVPYSDHLPIIVDIKSNA